MKPPGSKKQKSKCLPLECRWNDCNEVFSGELRLNEHITKHLDEYLGFELEDENDDCGMVCLWSKCKFRTECIAEFQRHVYYHGYYTGLLEQGKYECDNNPHIPACTAPKRVGDIVPLMEHDFCCRWIDCERSFHSIVEFQDHIVQHASFDYEIQKSPEDKRPKTQCNWDFCDKILDNIYRLIEHIRTHSNKKHVACYNCGEIFRTKTTLFDHLRRQPDNNTHKYQCAQCFKYFATEKLLRGHVVKHVNCYKCTMCDMTCCSTSALATHIRYRHIKDKPFSCENCDTCFVRKSDLVKHTHMAHSKEGYKCDEPGCDYSVRTSTQMRRHLLEVHRNSPIYYTCHCCDKFLKSGKALSVHLKKKHDFQLPSGHKRFTYRQDENGFYRLETMRIESLEVTEQILKPSEDQSIISQQSSIDNTDSNTYEIVNMPKTDNDNHMIIIANDLKSQDTVGSYEIVNMPKTDNANHMIIIANDLKLQDTVGSVTVSLPNLTEL